MHTTTLIDRIIELALVEDGEDITSKAVFSETDTLEAVMIAKAPGVIAGCAVARRVFSTVNPSTSCRFEVEDGACITPGTRLALIEGQACSVLKAERVALNFLQRMSGIASATAAYVQRVAGTPARILDTRKTAPGMRVLDKLAVSIGGGVNHRMGLWDMVMIKDNHIDAAGSIPAAVTRTRLACPGVPIEVEARTLGEVEIIMGLNVDRIMLDNFSLQDMRRAVELVASRVPLEASGGVNLERVRDIALTGVDYISVGELTHSVRALDISMIIKERS